jgi:hypothetical protein
VVGRELVRNKWNALGVAPLPLVALLARRRQGKKKNNVKQMVDPFFFHMTANAGADMDRG